MTDKYTILLDFVKDILPDIEEDKIQKLYEKGMNLQDLKYYIGLDENDKQSKNQKALQLRQEILDTLQLPQFTEARFINQVIDRDQTPKKPKTKSNHRNQTDNDLNIPNIFKKYQNLEKDQIEEEFQKDISFYEKVFIRYINRNELKKLNSKERPSYPRYKTSDNYFFTHKETVIQKSTDENGNSTTKQQTEHNKKSPHSKYALTNKKEKNDDSDQEEDMQSKQNQQEILKNLAEKYSHMEFKLYQQQVIQYYQENYKACEIPSQKLMQNSLDTAKKKLKQGKSVIEFINEFKSKYTNKKLCMSKIDSLPNNPDCSIIILSTYEALNKVREQHNSQQIFSDDDYDTPTGIYFANHYSTICSNTKTPYLICTVLMQGKKIENFSDEIISLDNFFRMTIKKGLLDCFNEYVGDFQKSRIKAIEEFGLKFRGCEFHYIQAQVRYIKKIGLFKKCFSPINKLIFNYWINEKIAKISQWNHYQSIKNCTKEQNQIRKTGNLVSEGKISQINRKLNYSSQPSVNVFMNAIDEQMYEDQLKINNRRKLPDYGVTESEKENNVISKHLIMKLRDNISLYYKDDDDGLQFQEVKNFYEAAEGDTILEKLQNLFCSQYFDEEQKNQTKDEDNDDDNNDDNDDNNDDDIDDNEEDNKNLEQYNEKDFDQNSQTQSKEQNSDNENQDSESNTENNKKQNQKTKIKNQMQVEQNNEELLKQSIAEKQNKNKHLNPKVYDDIEEKRKQSKIPFQVNLKQIQLDKDIVVRFQSKKQLYYYIPGMKPDCTNKNCHGTICIFSQNNTLKQKCDKGVCGLNKNLSNQLSRKLYESNEYYFQSVKIKYSKTSSLQDYPELKGEQITESSDSSDNDKKKKTQIKQKTLKEILTISKTKYDFSDDKGPKVNKIIKTN